MIDPLKGAIISSASSGISVNKPGNNTPSSADFVVQGSADSKKASSETETKDFGKKDLIPDDKQNTGGELKKTEVKDGQLVTKVYDSKGRLLRTDPPGYLTMKDNIYG